MIENSQSKILLTPSSMATHINESKNFFVPTFYPRKSKLKLFKKEKTKFNYIDFQIYSNFNLQIPYSPAIDLMCYDLKEKVSQKNLISEITSMGIYTEVDLAQINNIINDNLFAEPLLIDRTGALNLFFVRDKNNCLFELILQVVEDSLNLFTFNFNENYFFYPGIKLFLRPL